MSLLTELDALFAARLGRGAVREGLSDEGLCPLSAADSASLVAAFRQGLRARARRCGGATISSIELRYADGRAERA